MNARFKDQEVMKKFGVRHESWAPFGEGKNAIFTNPILESIGKKYGKTPAQVILRWLVQRDIVVLTKSVHKERMEENFNIFDFELTSEDMENIKKIDTKMSLFFDHRDVDTVEWFDSMVKIRRENKK